MLVWLSNDSFFLVQVRFSVLFTFPDSTVFTKRLKCGQPHYLGKFTLPVVAWLSLKAPHLEGVSLALDYYSVCQVHLCNP